MDGTDLRNIIAPVLKDRGFCRKASTWHRVGKEIVAVVNLQRSAWSALYYLNLGVSLRALSDDVEPKEYKCHIRCRPAALGLEDGDGRDQTLNLESALEPAERERRIRELTLKCVDWLDAISTEASLKSFLVSFQEPAHVLASLAARRHLGVE